MNTNTLELMMAKNLIFIIILGGTTGHISAQINQQPPRKLKQYSMEQAISDRAQLHTMAFSGLAFITGNYGADTFFPPGKVSDFFGFQYMRDNDKNEMGHNTDFLTRIANNIIQILSPEQLKLFVELAKKQTPLYEDFAFKRFELIKAFRKHLEFDSVLSFQEIVDYGRQLYNIDAQLTYDRAIVYGKIVNSFSKEQKELISKLDFSNSATWPVISEKLDKRNMSHRAHVAVMTYASELFSWYAGSVTSDTYFCPERHASYFGGFYLKDYPAMGNPGYNISTALTGDKGKEFINTLSQDQVLCLNKTLKNSKPLLNEIVRIRGLVSQEIRKVIINNEPDKDKITILIGQYGELDAWISYTYATCFASINKSLNNNQRTELYKIRNLDILPKGYYIYSDPVESKP